jgi:hypothetical protein
MRLKPRSEAGKRENSFKSAPKKEENPFSLKFSVDVVKGFIHKGLKVFLLLHPPPRWVVSTLKPSLFPPGFQRLATKTRKTRLLRFARSDRLGGVTARWYVRFRSSLSFSPLFQSLILKTLHEKGENPNKKGKEEKIKGC